MRIVITGSQGYLGSRLARMFGESRHTVLAMRRFGTELPSADAVIHTACCYGRAGESRAEIFAANLDWPSRLLEMLPPGALFLNTDTVLPPGLNSYAASKASFRQAGAALAGKQGIQWCNLRLEHFFGPGEGNDKFITRTVRSCLAGGELKLTRGDQQRDFIYIDDVVRAFDVVFRIAAERRIAESKAVSDFYAGTGEPVRIRELVERINLLCGSRGTLRFGALACREGEPTELEMRDAEPLDHYGWRHAVELQRGLEQVVSCACS